MYSKKLKEDRNELITRYEDTLSQAKTEERALTDEEIEILNEIKANVDKLTASIEAEEALAEMEIAEDNTEEETEVEETRSVEVMEREAFDAYLRGVVNERANELTPAATSGGVLIPTTIVDQIIKKIYDVSPILERATRFNIKGNVDVPVYPHSGTGVTVDYRAEFSEITGSSGRFDTVTLGSFLIGALTKISRSLINNAKFDVVGFVVNDMAENMARFCEGEFLNGTADKIDGLSTLTNGITTASASAITADEVIALHDSIKDAYQQDAIWIMSSSTRTALRSLKTQQGIYLLNDDISAPFGTSILGKPVYVSDNMDDIAGGKVVVYYGDMKGLGVKFSEDIEIEVLRERYAAEHAVGVVGWAEVDAKVINEQAIAKLTMHSA